MINWWLRLLDNVVAASHKLSILIDRPSIYFRDTCLLQRVLSNAGIIRYSPRCLFILSLFLRTSLREWVVISIFRPHILSFAVNTLRINVFTRWRMVFINKDYLLSLALNWYIFRPHRIPLWLLIDNGVSQWLLLTCLILFPLLIIDELRRVVTLYNMLNL